jgi:formyl-CoA transferase
MDLTVQAVSGIMASTGWPDGPPLKAGAAIADLGAGVHLYGAIVTALFHRERTGKASVVEVSMLEAVYQTLASNLGLALASGKNYIPRTGNKHGGLSVSPYNVYPCSDGHVAIICNTDEQWQLLVRSLELPQLEHDPRLAEMSGRIKHMDYLDAEIAKATRHYEREKLFHRLNSIGVPCGSVRNLFEVMHDPQMLASGMLQEVVHPAYGKVNLPHTPLRFVGQDRLPYVSSVALGAHNEEILGHELGLTSAELADLRAQEVI